VLPYIPFTTNKLFKCQDDHRKYLSEIRILEDIYVHDERQNDPITKMTIYRHFRAGEYRIPVWQLNGTYLIRKFAAIIAAIIVVQLTLIF